MTPIHDFVQIKTYFLTKRDVTLMDVARVYNVDHGYLKNVAAREHWYDERKEIWDNSTSNSSVSAKIAEKVADSIADVKVRHAQIGKTLQSVAMSSMIDTKTGKPKIIPEDAYQAVAMIRTGVQMERDALGLNEKQVKDEVYEKFSQYLFIFNLKDDELRNFIKSVDASTEGEVIDAGETILQHKDS